MTPVPAAPILRRLALIVYGSLALLCLALPQQVADRLDDFEPNAAAHAGRVAAEGLAQVMARTGLPQVFAATRGAFMTMAGERR